MLSDDTKSPCHLSPWGVQPPSFQSYSSVWRSTWPWDGRSTCIFQEATFAWLNSCCMPVYSWWHIVFSYQNMSESRGKGVQENKTWVYLGESAFLNHMVACEWLKETLSHFPYRSPSAAGGIREGNAGFWLSGKACVQQQHGCKEPSQQEQCRVLYLLHWSGSS